MSLWGVCSSGKSAVYGAICGWEAQTSRVAVWSDPGPGASLLPASELRLPAAGHWCLGIVTLPSQSNRNAVNPHCVSLYKVGGEQGITVQGKEALPQQNAASVYHTAFLPPVCWLYSVGIMSQEEYGLCSPIHPPTPPPPHFRALCPSAGSPAVISVSQGPVILSPACLCHTVRSFCPPRHSDH